MKQAEQLKQCDHLASALAAGAACLAAVAGAFPPSAWGRPDAAPAGAPEPPAALTLMADPSPLSAGQPFFLWVSLIAPPGWHTYWINPGDTGMAPDFRWTLPPGVSIVDTRYPVPKLINDGVSLAIGYEGRAAIMVELAADAAALESKEMEIGLKAVWMVCKDLCLPIESERRIKLRPGKNGAPAATEAVSATSREDRERLPLPAPDWEVSAAFTAEEALVRVAPPPAIAAAIPDEAWQNATLFPLQSNMIDLSVRVRWRREAAGVWTAVLGRGIEPRQGGDGLFSALLVLPEKDGVRSWLISGKSTP